MPHSQDSHDNRLIDRRVRMGERAKKIRHERGLTLQEIANQSGLAVSTVSKIERGVMAPTYDRFSQLADGLGVDIAALFSENGGKFAAGGLAIARSGDFKRHETDNYIYEMLFPELWQKTMTPMLGTLSANEKIEFDRFVRHGGEEFLMVLEGRVIVHLEDRDPVLLQCGESIYFDSNRGHLYAAAGAEDARILVMCTKITDLPR